MNSGPFRRALVFGRRYIISVTTVALLAMGFYLWQAGDRYQSTAYIYVSPEATATESAIRAHSYAQMMSNDPVIAAAADGLSASVDEISRAVDAKVLSESSIIRLRVQSDSAERSQRIATTVLSEFARVQGSLPKAPAAEGAIASADYTVTQTPQLPAGPVPSNYVWNLLLALVIGLFLGYLFALWRTVRDTSVKGPSDLARSVQAPLLGAVAYDPTVINEPLLTSLEPQHPRVEAFRVLRTNLQFVDVDSDSRVVVVTSSVPGEGKSSTTANLAIILAQTGMRVAVVEGDLRRPTIGKYLGVPQDIGVTTVLIGRTDLGSAMQPAITPGLEVLASGRRPPNPAELIQTRAMENLISNLRSQFDIVLIDAPPLLPVTDGALLASIADGVVLVVRHGSTKHQEVKAAVDRLTAVNARLFGVVLNMTPHSSKSAFASGYSYTYEDPNRARKGITGRRARR